MHFMLPLKSVSMLLTLFTLSLAFGACGQPKRASAAHAELPDVLEVEITGDDFNWHVRYPGADGKLGTDDDVSAMRDLHVPVNTRTRLHLRSRDYIYNLALPDLSLKEIAVPNLEFFLEFETGAPRTVELRGDQMCGWTHPQLLGKLFIESTDEFWNAMETAQRH